MTLGRLIGKGLTTEDTTVDRLRGLGVCWGDSDNRREIGDPRNLSVVNPRSANIFTSSQSPN
jgi:hypothetical protein